MGIFVSMLMITVGAIMRFAVSAKGNGFNVHTTGVVLIVVGVVAAVLSIAFWASWGGFSRRTIVVRGARRTVLGEPTVTPDRERDLL
jgi:hypothetical protein